LFLKRRGRFFRLLLVDALMFAQVHSSSGAGARPIETLNLPPPLVTRLVAAGFQRVADFAGLNPTDIMTEAGVTQVGEREKEGN
jgi:hypothetical protein